MPGFLLSLHLLQQLLLLLLLFLLIFSYFELMQFLLLKHPLLISANRHLLLVLHHFHLRLPLICIRLLQLHLLTCLFALFRLCLLDIFQILFLFLFFLLYHFDYTLYYFLTHFSILVLHILKCEKLILHKDNLLLVSHMC